ncbi:MAG TPA: hypothetical protein VF185_04405 [Patescibacteria group bacterium]
MFITPPVELQEIQLLNLFHLALTPLALRLIGIIFRVLGSLLFSLVAFYFVKPNKHKNLFLAATGLMFFLSPWESLISTFYLVQSILIFLLLVVLKFKKRILLIPLLLISIFFLYKTYAPTYLFTNKLSSSNLLIEINDRQKADYLIEGRKFVIPRPIRGVIYNKQFLAGNKILNQFISFFDFEHLVSPLDSYELIRLSGISPKGNLPLFYLWDIPLVIYGVYLLTKENKNNKKYVIFLFFISLIPYMIFEKKLLPQTAFLTLIPILLIEPLAIYKIIKLKNKIPLLLVSLLFALSIFSYYTTFYFSPQTYQKPESYLYEEISKWLYNNYDPSKTYIITNKFGPTDKMVSFYLQKTYSNVNFEEFDLSEKIPQKNTYYVGLEGEFVGHGKNLEQRTLPEHLNIVDKITGQEEPVFEYGKEIWIGLYK